ncbi:MAG: hypothetical protein OEU46_11115 [Alphaproteobacteria bacterium]|nr:hypothetical protein [Alphaproteobacteria bacterium]
MRAAHAIAAHLLLTVAIISVYVSIGLDSVGVLIAALIIGNAAPLLLRSLFVGLSYAPRDMPSNDSEMHDGPVHKDSLIIRSYPLIVSLIALFVLLLPLIASV